MLFREEMVNMYKYRYMNRATSQNVSHIYQQIQMRTKRNRRNMTEKITKTVVRLVPIVVLTVM